MPCSSSPAPASLRSKKKSTMLCTRRFTLSDAHGFNQDHIVACGFAEGDGLPGVACYPAQRIAGGGWPDKCLRVFNQGFHAGFVAQNTSLYLSCSLDPLLSTATSFAQPCQIRAQRFYKRAFSNARNASNSNSNGRFPGVLSSI